MPFRTPMVIESPISRGPRAGACLRWSRLHVAPVEGLGLLPGLSIRGRRAARGVPSPLGPATARTSAASIDPRGPPGASLLAVLPPVHRPTGQRCLGVVRRLEPCHVLNSRVAHARARVCFSAIGKSNLWREQPVVVHLGFDGRDDHAPPGRGECMSGGRDGETSVPTRPAANVVSRSKPLCLPQG
jgi:hypothetical protein